MSEKPTSERVKIGHWPLCPSRDNDASTSILGKQACNSRNCDHATVLRLVEAARLFDESIRRRTIRVLPEGPTQTETGATMKVGHAIVLMRDALAALDKGE